MLEFGQIILICDVEGKRKEEQSAVDRADQA
jgi:hypothetical protein